jgi:hypothetical protein
MRRACAIRSALFLAVLMLPVWAVAEFQLPSTEELQMTAEPKAPGASAIYLDREEDCNRGLRTETFFARIKILTEKGMDLATIRHPVQPRYCAGEKD